MRSADALQRALSSLKRRLPQPDIEYEVYWGNEDVPNDGSEVIVIDFAGLLKLEGDGLEDREYDDI